MAFAAIHQRDLEAGRRRAFGVAYRMLGSVSEAEDVAQEAMLRLARTEEELDEPVAWLTTVATRLSIDVLRLARVRRETYVGPWLPEPIVEDAGAGPGDRAELAESISQAFLLVLERLTPMERAAFLLREVFDYEYSEIAAIIGRTEVNCRQIVTRARKHVRSSRRRFGADASQHGRLLERFLAATERGDVAALEEMLAADAAFYADGGGQVAAARRPLLGANRIARALVALARKQRRRGGVRYQPVTVNGGPGALRRTSDGVLDVLSFDVVDGRVQTLCVMRNPDKLGHVRGPALP